MFGGKRKFNQEKTVEAAHSAIDQATALAQSIVDQAASRAVDGAQKARAAAPSGDGPASGILEAASNRASAGVQKARETGASVGAHASDRFDQASKSFERDIAPSVKDVAFQAATLAVDLWQSAREKTEHVIEAGRSEIPDAASHALKAAERGAEEVGGLAKSASKQAATATADAGKDTGATLLWAGAATGIVLYGILQKERRDQVLRYAQSAFSITRDLISDYKGQDGRFDAPAA